MHTWRFAFRMFVSWNAIELYITSYPFLEKPQSKPTMLTIKETTKVQSYNPGMYKIHYIEMIRGMTDFDVDVLCTITKSSMQYTNAETKDQKNTITKTEYKQETTPKIEQTSPIVPKTEDLKQQSVKAEHTKHTNISFGQEMHQASEDEQYTNEDDRKTVFHGEIHKTHSLVRSEGMVYMMICDSNNELIHKHEMRPDYSIFGSCLHFLHKDEKIQSLENDVKDVYS